MVEKEPEKVENGTTKVPDSKIGTIRKVTTRLGFNITVYLKMPRPQYEELQALLDVRGSSVSDRVTEFLNRLAIELHGGNGSDTPAEDLHTRLNRLEGDAHALYVEAGKQEKMLKDDGCYAEFTDDIAGLVKRPRVDRVDKLISGDPNWKVFEAVSREFLAKYHGTDRAGQAAVFVRYMRKLKQKRIVENEISELETGKAVEIGIEGEGENKVVPSSEVSVESRKDEGVDQASADAEESVEEDEDEEEEDGVEIVNEQPG